VGDPRTPDKYKKMSKRCWDGLVRVWRKQLHKYDPPKEDGEEELSELDDDEADELALSLGGKINDLEFPDLGDTN